MTLSAAFDSPYTGNKYDPNLAMMLEVLTIRPPGFMCGSAAWMSRKGPRTFDVE